MNKYIAKEIERYRKDDFVAGCNKIIDSKDKPESEKKPVEDVLMRHVTTNYPNLFSK